MNGFQELANAIIEQAAKDYRAARKKLAKDPHNHNAYRTTRDVETFFLSDWFRVLTALDGEQLLEMLKEESE